MGNIKGLGILGVLLGIILVFLLAGSLIPTTQQAGDDLGQDNSASCLAVGCYWNQTGADKCVNVSTAPSGDCATTPPKLPLSSLFASGGLVFVLIAVALLLFAIARIKLKK